MKKDYGFTIVELIIVVVVIGILAAISIVSYRNIKDRAYDSAIASTYSQIAKSLEIYQSDKGTYPNPAPTVFVYKKDAGTATSLEDYFTAANLPALPYAEGISQYVYNPSTGGYGIRLFYKTKPACKAGVDMNPGWWASLPNC